MFYEFSTTTHGKWVLAGEHAVLRGKGALVFPVKEKKLALNYTPSNSALSIECEGSSGMEMRFLLWNVLERGQQLTGKTLNQLTGHFHLQSNVPIGGGMGASAALCVAVARWFAAQNLIAPETTTSFARNLEDLFHGQSSGLDIAGAAADKGVYFQQGIIQPLTQHWQPCWYLSSCEQIGLTAHCIAKVKQLWQDNPEKAAAIDEVMADAVDKARAALKMQASEDAFALLSQAIHQGYDCFRRWGLISENLAHHIALLQKAGAAAVKPTGSGGGGYVVSLWDKPPKKLPVEVIILKD